MKIQVFSRNTIQEFKTEIPHIVISIRSPNSECASLVDQSSRLSAIFLEFHDIDETIFDIEKKSDCPLCGGSGFIKKWRHIENGQCFRCNREGLDLILFCSDHAKIILNFVEFYKNKVDLIAVNCEAGISRSSGISAALSFILNGSGSDMFYFNNYIPNMLVYKKILDTYYEKENEENNS